MPKVLPPDVGEARRDGAVSPIVGLEVLDYPRCGHQPHGRWLERKLREAIMKKQITLAIVVGMAVIATPVSFNAPREDQAIITLNSAEAKVGQPLSATSVAGVNRRQGRREKRKTN
jgi:hypothetical protein